MGLRKGVRQGCILSPCLFNLYAEYIKRNAGLEEAQAGIKIAGRNIKNLRYADDTTFTAESEEELKSLLKKVKGESEKAGLKLNIHKTKIMASGPITSWQIDGETIGNRDRLYFGRLQNHCCSPHSSVGKSSACNAGDPGSMTALGRSPGEGNGNPFQYSCLGNPMDTEEPGGLQSMGSQRIGHD